MRKQVCESEPQSIRSLNPSIPGWLEGIIRKLHAKDPAQRFGSAAEVSELLEQCLAHVQQPGRQALPVAAVVLGKQTQVSASRSRNWRWAFAVVLFGIVFIGVVLFAGRPKPHTAEEVTWTASTALLQESQPRILEVTWEALDQLRQRAVTLERDLHASAPDSDDVAAQLAAIRQTIRRLQYSDSFSELDFERPQTGEYP